MRIAPKAIPNDHAVAAGIVVAALVAAILSFAYVRDSGASNAVVAIPLSVAVTGVAAFFFIRRELWMLAGGLAGGLLLGLFSSVGMLTQDVYGMFIIVASTVASSFMLGMMVGAFFEVVFWAHRFAHRK